MNIRRTIERHMPDSLKRPLRNCALISLDALDSIFGLRRDMVPPRRLNFVGSGDFEAVGDEFFSYFVELCGLTPEQRVLDLGCGIGRMARPLMKYLTTGSYEGVDIVPAGIDWATQNITRRHPNFRFQLLDVQNPMYNPRGRFNARDYRFPFADGEFDFIFLTSVFTHMFKLEVENYLREVVRMLRPGATCLITFFLLNPSANEGIASGRSSLAFESTHADTRVNDGHSPAEAVAFEEQYIRELYGAAGLNLTHLKYGRWCGRSNALSYQDIVVAKNSSNNSPVDDDGRSGN